MKKIICFLAVLLPLLSHAQQNLENNKFKIDASGNVSTSGNIKSKTRVTSATSLLFKTDQTIFSSGNITDSLPAVTAADTGLSITIKNVGTFTDLITVVAKGGKTIDSKANSLLTRWQSRTYIVNSAGNWYVREKQTRTDNIYDISSMGSWTTIPEMVAFLNLHMSAPTVVRINGGTFTLPSTQLINLPYPVTFEGISYGETFIRPETGLAGKPMFRCLTECYFKMLIFDTIGLALYGNAAGEDAIRFVGAGTYNEVKDCGFEGFQIAILDSSSAEIWVFENDISNCKGAGVKMHSAIANARVRINSTDFINCKRGVWLSAGSNAYVDINGGTSFRCGATSDTGVVYVPATFAPFQNIYISGTKWNNIGTYVTGPDYTLASGRDANIFDEDNSGRESKSPHCKVNLLNNTDTTRAVSANVFRKARWTANTSSYTCKWTIAANMITYQPTNKRDAQSWVSCNVISSNANRNIDIAIVKNGNSAVKYGQMTCRVTAQNVPFAVSTPVYVSDMAPGEYLELWVASGNAGDVIIVQDVSWYTETR